MSVGHDRGNVRYDGSGTIRDCVAKSTTDSRRVEDGNGHRRSRRGGVGARAGAERDWWPPKAGEQRSAERCSWARADIDSRPSCERRERGSPQGDSASDLAYQSEVGDRKQGWRRMGLAGLRRMSVDGMPCSPCLLRELEHFSHPSGCEKYAQTWPDPVSHYGTGVELTFSDLE
nr:hypothetical protein CFP56_36183 [Quercus suber]